MVKRLKQATNEYASPPLPLSLSPGIRDLYSKRASRQKEFHKRPLSAANTYAVVTVSWTRIPLVLVATLTDHATRDRL